MPINDRETLLRFFGKSTFDTPKNFYTNYLQVPVADAQCQFLQNNRVCIQEFLGRN